MKKCMCGLLGGWLAICGMAQTTIYVATDGRDDGPGTDADPCLTISNALFRAEAGDTVLVKPGRYQLTAQLNITNDIVVRGQAAPEGVVISRDPACSTMRCVNISSAGAVFEGFTVTNGYRPWPENGAGIQVTAGKVINCNVLYNRCGNFGGGIYLSGSNAGAYNCRVISNSYSGGVSTLYGGGVYLANNAVLRDSIISGNVCNAYGGGVWARSGSYVADCLVAGNYSSNNYGGGLYLEGSTAVNLTLSCNQGRYGGGARLQNGAVMRSCLIAYNTHPDIPEYCAGGGLYIHNTSTVENCTIVSNMSDNGGIHINTNNGIVLRNCIIYENWRSNGVPMDVHFGSGMQSGTNLFFNCCAGTMVLPVNQGNITNQPGFRRVDDPADWRLQKGSLCINTGIYRAWMDSAADLDGQARLDRFQRLPDMGCYEYLPAGNLMMIR